MKENLKKYRSCLFVTGLLAFLVHGAKLNAGIIGIDTEDLLHLQDDFYGGWLHTGRQGLVFLKYVLGNAHFNPYFAGSMTLLLFGAAVAAFLWLWDRTGGKAEEGLAWGCGSLLWISHPAMAEQFYFSLQSMEICLAMVLTAAALYLSFQWVDRHVWRYVLGSVCILLLVFSVYQSFVVMYIFGIVAMLLLQALREASEGAEVRTGAYVRRVALHCGLFLAAFLLNTLITRLFFGSSSYLENQIFWGHASVKDCLHGIAGHVVKAFTGYDSVFYHWGLGLLAAADLGLLLWFLKGSGRKGRKNGGVVLFFYGALLTTPFLMSVLLGGTPAMRSQLALPALTGFLGWLGIKLVLLQKGRVRREGIFRAALLCIGAVSLVCGMEQAKVTWKPYYTDRCRYEQDAALGRAVISQIEAETAGEEAELPVFFVGSREFTGNHACVKGEIIGISFFEHDRRVEPEFYWSTRRILGFLHTLGADYIQIPEEWMGDALARSAEMPSWPAEGSVRAVDGMVIVKMSAE